MNKEVKIIKVDKKVYRHIYCPKGVKYEIRNSNGGLLGGTWNLESAIEMAKEHIARYKEDKLNNHLDVWVEELSDN